MKSHHFHYKLSMIAAAATATLLAACGGDEATLPPAVAISGVVADGPLQGAAVCYDLNDNAVCDAADVRATAPTDADGRYTLQVPAALAGKHAVIAEVPATAIDKDTGVAVGAALVFKSPATGRAVDQSVFVSALTTAVVELAALNGQTLAEAEAQVKASLKLAVSPLADFVASGGDAGAALAARALTSLAVQATQLANTAGASSAQAQALVKTTLTSQLDLLSATLAESTAANTAAKVQEAVASTLAELNLSPATVKAVAEAVAKPSVDPGPPGPFVSLRRLAYTDANNYSYTVFVGDNSQTDASGEFVAHEVRKAVVSSADVAYNRNQAYWTGSAWQPCAVQWQASTGIKQSDRGTRQSSLYCGASKSQSTVRYEDISGKSLREVVAQIRAYPLADGLGAHTDSNGLPVKWGPDPALLAAELLFPAGSLLSARSSLADIGGVDRLELSTKSSVRWADGRFRQASTLEQYSGMPGDLASASVVPGNGNTVFVFDLPLAEQPDATLESFKRWRAGFDVAALKIRFYECDVRKADAAALNCATKGDGTLAISTQGDARLMRVASGYPAELTQRLRQQRFWAERSGTVFRGVRDLQRTRHDQRLNAAAWAALRGALGIPAHGQPVAPAASGANAVLRHFEFTDANNYNYRSFTYDNSVLDAAGYFNADDLIVTVANGAVQPHARNRLYWTGSQWFDCPVGEGSKAIRANDKAPFDSLFCQGYADERVSSTTLTLDGRRMADVVNDIRAYGSKNFGFDYAGWGPNPAVHTQLASALFPAGATMEYRGNLRKATPIAIATAAGDQVRVAPAPNTNLPFNTWPHATGLDDFIAKYPGDMQGGGLNGSVAFYVWGHDLAAAPSAEYTTRVEIRVAFDATGQRARFYQNNRSASTGFTANYVRLLDTTYVIETLGNHRVLKFAAMPDGFEQQFRFSRLFAEREGGVWYAYKDTVTGSTDWSIRMNREAGDALRGALGIN